jgi:N-acetyl-anhydromuramyl-L-alanine amidase AmpD
MYKEVAHICKRFMDMYGFGITDIRGHFAYAPKTCPGKLFNWLKLAQYIQAM